MAARLAIARAQRQLAQEAQVYLHTRNFAVRSNRTCTLVCSISPLSHYIHRSSTKSAHARSRRRSTARPLPTHTGRRLTMIRAALSASRGDPRAKPVVSVRLLTPPAHSSLSSSLHTPLLTTPLFVLCAQKFIQQAVRSNSRLYKHTLPLSAR